MARRYFQFQDYYNYRLLLDFLKNIHSVAKMGYEKNVSKNLIFLSIFHGARAILDDFIMAGKFS